MRLQFALVLWKNVKIWSLKYLFLFFIIIIIIIILFLIRAKLFLVNKILVCGRAPKNLYFNALKDMSTSKLRNNCCPNPRSSRNSGKWALFVF